MQTAHEYRARGNISIILAIVSLTFFWLSGGPRYLFFVPGLGVEVPGKIIGHRQQEAYTDPETNILYKPIDDSIVEYKELNGELHIFKWPAHLSGEVMVRYLSLKTDLAIVSPAGLDPNFLLPAIPLVLALFAAFMIFRYRRLMNVTRASHQELF